MDAAPNNYTGSRVRLCEDGKYRWTYRVNMYKNPAIFLVVFKIIAILFCIPLVIALISAAVKGDWAEAWDENIKIWLIVFVVFLAITVLAYLIVAWMYGGRYVVHFTLDEEGVVHEQETAQAKRAQKMGLLTAAAGILAKRPATVGSGMLAASRNTSTSVFANVRRIIPHRRQNLIKVNQLLDRNQVYVPDEDFDFVLDFIRRHCPEAK